MREIETPIPVIPSKVQRAMERITLKGLVPMLDPNPTSWVTEAEKILGQGRENATARVWHIDVKSSDGVFLGTVHVTERHWRRRFTGARYYRELKNRTPLNGTDFTFIYNTDALRAALGVEKEASS